jgi:hypothetical protein
MRIVPLRDVFGVHVPPPKETYVDRAGFDQRLKHFLTSGRHLVIYGPSKQGKTALWRNALHEGEYILVQCRERPSVEELYIEILGQLGEKVTKEVQTKKGTGGKAGGKVAGGFNWFGLGKGEAEASGEVSHNREATTSEQPIGHDIQVLSYVAGAIKKTHKKVVVDDFHYVPEEAKKIFARDLKALLDLEVPFILVGAWNQQHVFTQYNGELRGRFDEINLHWEDAELLQVLTLGEEALRLAISQEIKNTMVQDASGNVGLLQRMAEKLCVEAQIYETYPDDPLPLDDMELLVQARKAICNEAADRYRRFGWAVPEGFAGSTGPMKKVYMYIIQACVKASDSELLGGMSQAQMIERIQAMNRRVSQKQIREALSRVDKLQSEKDIYPVILAYNDVNRVLTLADRELIFYRKYGGPHWPWEDAE